MQEVIVYHGPLEYAFYHMPFWFYFLIIAILVGGMACGAIADYQRRKRRGY